MKFHMFVNKQQTKIIDYLRIRIEYCYQKVRTYIFPTLLITSLA